MYFTRKQIAFVVASATAVAAIVVPDLAMAASQLPADALTAVGTDAIDTAKDVVTNMIPVAVGMSIAWFVLSGTKKGLGKAGVK